MVERLLEKHPDNLFLQFLANKRVIYALYLVVWILIILVLYFLFIKPGSNFNNNAPKEEKMDYAAFKETIAKNNYRYRYVSLEGETKIVFNGERLANEEVGYYESSEGITKYYLNDDAFYNIASFELTPNETNPIDGTYLNYRVLFDKLDSITPETESFIYTFKNDGFYGKIDLSSNDKALIDIEENNIKYQIEFYDFGEVSVINY